VIWEATVDGSLVLPAKASIESGTPSPSHSPDGGEVFQIVLVLQGELDCFELARRAAGEVCDGAVLDLGAFAVVLAKKVAAILAVLAGA